MGIFERFRKPKEQKKPQAGKVVDPVCNKCGTKIECLNVSIGEAIEQQGAFLYSGSEGHLYEPMFDGVICLSCSRMLCDRCQSELVDESRCPICCGNLRQIIYHRLPKAT